MVSDIESLKSGKHPRQFGVPLTPCSKIHTVLQEQLIAKKLPESIGNHPVCVNEKVEKMLCKGLIILKNFTNDLSGYG